MRKRIISFLCAAATGAATLIGQLIPMKAEALLFTPSTTIQSEAAVLMNLDVGQIVYEKSADLKEMPGQLVQIMTAVIVLENCPDLTAVNITAGEEMYEIFKKDEYPEDLRYANIEAGDTLTAEELMYAMMLTSSVEAAYMLAEHFGGTQDHFADLMNEKAAELEMTNTRYLNGTGLYSARQLTSARDTAKLLAYAMTVPRFENIACANGFTATSTPSTERAEDAWTWKHSNLLVDENDEYYCNGVRGIKTGNSQEGGRCLACKGSRDGNNYLVVTLNAPMEDPEGNSHFYHLDDARNILEWAFVHLSFTDILNENTQLGEVRVRNADEVDYVLVRPTSGYSCIWCDTIDINSVQQISDWKDEVEAPVREGDKLGKVLLKYSGETLAEIDVVASSDVGRSFWKYNLSEIPGFFRSKYLKATWILGIVLSVLYIGACVFFTIRYHEDRKRRAAARAGHLNSQKK